MSRGLAVAAMILLPALVSRADERDVIRDVPKLINNQQLAEAARVFDEGLKQYPKSRVLNSNSIIMYQAMTRSGRPDLGLKYLGGYIDYLVSKEGAQPSTAFIIGSYAQAYLTGMDGRKKATVADEKLESWLAEARQLDAEKFQPILDALSARKAVRLANAGKQNDARELLRVHLDSARKRFGAEPGQPQRALALIEMLKGRMDVETRLKSPLVEKATQEWLGFSTEQAKKHPANIRLIGAYFNAKSNQIGRLISQQPTEAAKALAEMQKFLDAMPDDNPNLNVLKRQLTGSVKQLKGMVDSSTNRLALVGKPAPPIGAADWVNSEELAPEDTKGKVVLIDFWAVWCGPCIRTFPHLREWQDKYGEKGLLIVGATRYYKVFQFANGRLGRGPQQTPEQEQKMIGEFAKHYKLKHRLAVVTPDSTLHKDYFATSIPQAVVIDRKGVVRLIRVGSGEQNAEAIREMIEKCLAEAAAE